MRRNRALAGNVHRCAAWIERSETARFRIARGAVAGKAGIVSGRISVSAWITIGCYGAAVIVSVCLAYRSGSAQIATAARLIGLGWLCSLQCWILFDGDMLALSYLAIDVVLAAAFYQLSKGRWFPAPLFFLHTATALFNFYILLIDQGLYWMIAILNRSFELALAYVILCAAYRIRRTA